MTVTGVRSLQLSLFVLFLVLSLIAAFALGRALAPTPSGNAQSDTDALEVTGSEAEVPDEPVNEASATQEPVFEELEELGYWVVDENAVVTLFYEGRSFYSLHFESVAEDPGGFRFDGTAYLHASDRAAELMEHQFSVRSLESDSSQGRAWEERPAEHDLPHLVPGEPVAPFSLVFDIDLGPGLLEVTADEVSGFGITAAQLCFITDDGLLSVDVWACYEEYLPQET